MKVGIDLGGTKTEIIVLDDSGLECWRKRLPTPKGQYQETVRLIVDLVREAKQRFDLPRDLPVGIGTPGAITVRDAQMVMKNCNSTVLNGQPLPSDLQSLLGCAVFIANDANCFALAETHSGVVSNMFDKTPVSVFGVILGTGVGGGIVVRGEVLTGAHSIAGEWGHNKVPASVLAGLPHQESQRPCYCGRLDCVETYLSGPGLCDSFLRRFDEGKSTYEIIDLLRVGDSQANEIWGAYQSQLAAALAQVVNILDPDVIVLGGGMSQINELYPPLRALMQEHVFTEHFNTPVVPASLGDSAGVFGAAWLR